jgi:hypothetical protein
VIEKLPGAARNAQPENGNFELQSFAKLAIFVFGTTDGRAAPGFYWFLSAGRP